MAKPQPPRSLKYLRDTCISPPPKSISATPLSAICISYFSLPDLACNHIFYCTFQIIRLSLMTVMNLGEANLRTVNSKCPITLPESLISTYLTFRITIVSKPQLVHSSSKQSIAASDYYSLASDDSSHHDHAPLQYQTPPSQIRSGTASPDVQQSEPTTSSLRPVKQSPPSRVVNPTVVRFSGTQADKKKASAGECFNSQKAVDCDISSTTPGVDDTPYIRFAIDQLTRDEELLGPRRQGGPSEELYPVDRIIPDEGLGYYGHGRRSTRRERQPPNPTAKNLKSPRELRYIQSICVLLIM